MLKKFQFFPIATLSGTIIGVGFFALPYITLKVGFWLMLAYFLILGILITLIHLIFGKLCLKTPDFKRLPGFAKFYLGSFWEKLALISIIFELSGALLAYLIIGSQFLKNLLPFQTPETILALLYFLIGAAFIYFGIKAISQIEFFDALLFSLILIFILVFGISKFNLKKILFLPKKEFLFLPFGPILFSLWGASILPEIEEMLKDQKEKMKKVILISILICALFYFSFAILVSGISGKNTSKDAISGLKEIFGAEILNLFYLFGIFATFTSFISLGLNLKNTFCYDLKMGKNLAFFSALLPPFLLYLFGFKDYLNVISFVGGIFLAINGILILLMYQKIEPNKKYLIFPLIFLLLGGIFYEFLRILT